MENKKLSLNIDFQFMKDKLSFMKNSSFHEAIVTIMASGENDNGTYFTRSSIEKALWSIKNIPLVGLFKEEENNFGGHEPVYEVRDGVMDMHFNTTPFGIIHESAKQWFEMIDENGVRKEYLVSECLLWKRQRGYELLKEKGKFSVSMEIEVTDGVFNDDTQLYEINDYIFTAVAILGEGVQPCFSSANVKLFSKDLEYNNMMADVKQFSKELLEFQKEGETMEETTQVVDASEVSEVSENPVVEVSESSEVSEVSVTEEYQAEEESVEETTEEVVEATEEQTFAAEDSQEQPAEEEQPEVTVEELLQQAVNATTTDEILDIFDQVLSVVGLGEIDIRTMFSKESDAKRELEEQLLATVTEFEKMKTEYERLVEFEKSILTEQKKVEVENLLNKFSTLEGFEGFEELKEKAFEIELSDLEQQLFALLGKKSFSLIKQDKVVEEPMTVVFEKVEKPMVNGIGVLDKYLIKK